MNFLINSTNELLEDLVLDFCDDNMISYLATVVIVTHHSWYLVSDI